MSVKNRGKKEVKALGAGRGYGREIDFRHEHFEKSSDMISLQAE